MDSSPEPSEKGEKDRFTSSRDYLLDSQSERQPHRISGLSNLFTGKKSYRSDEDVSGRSSPIQMVHRTSSKVEDNPESEFSTSRDEPHYLPGMPEQQPVMERRGSQSYLGEYDVFPADESATGDSHFIRPTKQKENDPKSQDADTAEASAQNLLGRRIASVVELEDHLQKVPVHTPNPEAAVFEETHNSGTGIDNSKSTNNAFPEGTFDQYNDESAVPDGTPVVSPSPSIRSMPLRSKSEVSIETISDAAIMERSERKRGGAREPSKRRLKLAQRQKKIQKSNSKDIAALLKKRRQEPLVSHLHGGTNEIHYDARFTNPVAYPTSFDVRSGVRKHLPMRRETIEPDPRTFDPMHPNFDVRMKTVTAYKDDTRKVKSFWGEVDSESYDEFMSGLMHQRSPVSSYPKQIRAFRQGVRQDAGMLSHPRKQIYSKAPIDPNPPQHGEHLNIPARYRYQQKLAGMRNRGSTMDVSPFELAKHHALQRWRLYLTGLFMVGLLILAVGTPFWVMQGKKVPSKYIAKRMSPTEQSDELLGEKLNNLNWKRDISHSGSEIKPRKPEPSNLLEVFFPETPKAAPSVPDTSDLSKKLDAAPIPGPPIGLIRNGLSHATAAKRAGSRRDYVVGHDKWLDPSREAERDPSYEELQEKISEDAKDRQPAITAVEFASSSSRGKTNIFKSVKDSITGIFKRKDQTNESTLEKPKKTDSYTHFGTTVSVTKTTSIPGVGEITGVSLEVHFGPSTLDSSSSDSIAADSNTAESNTQSTITANTDKVDYGTMSFKPTEKSTASAVTSNARNNYIRTAEAKTTDPSIAATAPWSLVPAYRLQEPTAFPVPSPFGQIEVINVTELYQAEMSKDAIGKSILARVGRIAAQINEGNQALNEISLRHFVKLKDLFKSLRATPTRADNLPTQARASQKAKTSELARVLKAAKAMKKAKALKAAKAMKKAKAMKEAKAWKEAKYKAWREAKSAKEANAAKEAKALRVARAMKVAKALREATPSAHARTGKIYKHNQKPKTQEDRGNMRHGSSYIEEVRETLMVFVWVFLAFFVLRGLKYLLPSTILQDLARVTSPYWGRRTSNPYGRRLTMENINLDWSAAGNHVFMERPTGSLRRSKAIRRRRTVHGAFPSGSTL